MILIIGHEYKGGDCLVGGTNRRGKESTPFLQLTPTRRTSTIS
jgi:hypothetical protein